MKNSHITIKNPTEAKEMDELLILTEKKISKENGILKANRQNLCLNYLNREENNVVHRICYEYRYIFYCQKLSLTFTHEIRNRVNLKDNATRPSWKKKWKVIIHYSKLSEKTVEDK